MFFDWLFLIFFFLQERKKKSADEVVEIAEAFEKLNENLSSVSLYFQFQPMAEIIVIWLYF